jgi:predicted AAA+ superfamily ATPase
MNIYELVSSLNPWWSDPDARAALGYPMRREPQALLLRRLLRLEDRRAMALVGPRQVGKTVILLQSIDDLLDQGWPPGNVTYFDFSDVRVTADLIPTEVTDVKPPSFDPEQPRVFLFDEVSRATNWDLWLKQAVDREEGRIGVADSAASLLRRDTRESGQGRWDQVRIEGLSFPEALRFLGEPGEPPDRTYALNPASLERYLTIGGFPEHLLRGAESPLARLEIGRRLRADVVHSAVYRDLARFGVDVDGARALFVYLVEDAGAIFNAARRGQDLDRDYRTIKSWLHYLEEAGLVALLPRFANKPSRRLQGSGSPKVYPTDHGLISALSIVDPSSGPVRGAIFETAVFRHLRELDRTWWNRPSYFRLDDEQEIDFVLELEGGKVAVEVTSARQVRAEKLDKLRRSAQRFGADRTVLVHGGVRDERDGDVRLVPLPRFLLDVRGLLEGDER